jgi:hypothetical protein
MIQLTPAQRNQVMCAANTLKINCRDAFFRGVARVLGSAPMPASNNDVTRAIAMCLEMVPAQDVIISRSTTPEECTEYYESRRY